MAMRYLILLIGLLALVTAPAHAEKRIALTFDDVPREKGAFLTPDERTDMLIAALKKAGVEQAAFFVTTGNLETPDGVGGEARIAKYAAAGHVIANHSYSHSHLTKMTADVVSGRSRPRFRMVEGPCRVSSVVPVSVSE